MSMDKIQKYRALIKEASEGCLSPEELMSSLDKLIFRMDVNERSQIPPIYTDEVTD